jgi:uncharacterized protein YkwD
MKKAVIPLLFMVNFFASAQTQQPVKISEFLKDKRQPTVLEIFTEFSQYRDSLNLSGLVLDSNLCKAAQLQADWIAVTGKLVHLQDRSALPSIPILKTPPDRGNRIGIKVSAENLYSGWKYLTADLIVNGWAESPGHQLNMIRKPVSGQLLKVGLAIQKFANDPNQIVVVLVIGESQP